jgi:hypothetical protein
VKVHILMRRINSHHKLGISFTKWIIFSPFSEQLEQKLRFCDLIDNRPGGKETLQMNHRVGHSDDVFALCNLLLLGVRGVIVDYRSRV